MVRTPRKPHNCSFPHAARRSALQGGVGHNRARKLFVEHVVSEVVNELEQQTAKEHSDSEAEIKELLGIDLDRMFAGVPGAGSHDAEVPAGVLGAVRVYDSGSDTFSLSEERFFLVGDGVSATWIAIMRGDSDFMRSYNHVAFQVHPGDLDAMRRAVDELGLECRPPRSRVEGEGQSVYFYDDDNHLFELHTGSLRDRLAVYVPAALSSHDAGN